MIYAARAADEPEEFIDKLRFWRDQCALPAELSGRLHRLRMWRNASEHFKAGGPKDEGELVEMLAACDALVECLAATLAA